MKVLPFRRALELVLTLVIVLPVVYPYTLNCNDPPAGMLFLGVSCTVKVARVLVWLGENEMAQAVRVSGLRPFTVLLPDEKRLPLVM